MERVRFVKNTDYKREIGSCGLNGGLGSEAVIVFQRMQQVSLRRIPADLGPVSSFSLISHANEIFDRDGRGSL